MIRLQKQLLILLLSFVLIPASWSIEPSANSHAYLSQLLNEANYVDPEAFEKIEHKYTDFIHYSNQKNYDENITLGDNLMEAGKVVGMVTLSSMIYGIIHNLILTQIDFDFYSGDNFRGSETRDFFPVIYESKSPVLYALLWGTALTWFIDLSVGGIAALAARSESDDLKLTWRDLVYPAGAVLSTNLMLTMIAGGLVYLTTNQTNRVVVQMQNISHFVSFLSAIAVPLLTSSSRPKETAIIKTQCMGFTGDILKLFKNNPDNPDIQDLVRFHLNSSFGNCNTAKVMI